MQYKKNFRIVCLSDFLIFFVVELGAIFYLQNKNKNENIQMFRIRGSI